MKFLIALFFTLSSVSLSAVTMDENGKLTPSILNKSKPSFDGHQIVLVGYVVNEPESYAIWDSKKAMLKGDVRMCVSLVYPKSIKSEVLKFNRKTATIYGTFKANVVEPGRVQLGLCNYSGIIVMRIANP